MNTTLEQTDEKRLRIEKFRKLEDEMLDFYCGDFANKGDGVSKRSDTLSLGIVIPHFNDSENLQKAAKEALKCVSSPSNLAVVDDCSIAEHAMKAKQICDSLGCKFLQFKDNQGPGAARYAGCEALETDLIQFCDSDDYLVSSEILIAQDFLSSNRDVHVVYGMMSCFDEEEHVWVPRDGHVWTAIEENFAHSGIMIGRTLALEVLATKPHPLFEDWATNLNIVFSHYVCEMLPIVTYRYRRSGKTRSHSSKELAPSIANMIKIEAIERFTNIGDSGPRRYQVLLQNLVDRTNAVRSSSPERPTPIRYKLLDKFYLPLVNNKFGFAVRRWLTKKLLH